MSSWLDTLNLITDLSPPNGLDDRSGLSQPVDSDLLSAQLEAWTNTGFTSTDSPLVPQDPLLPLVEEEADPGPPRPYHRYDYYTNKPSHNFKRDHDLLSNIDPSLMASIPFVQQHHGSVIDHSLPIPAFAQTGDQVAIDPSLQLLPQDLPVPIPASAVSPSDASPSDSAKPKSSRTSTKKLTIPKSNRGRKSAFSNFVPPPDLPEDIQHKLEEENRQAFEEDKRRRNTAASARFRVKKKQRESEMADTANQLKSRVSDLEKDVASLRSENKFLRELLGEKMASVPQTDVDAALKKRKLEA